jgi:hypothetical protein
MRMLLTFTCLVLLLALPIVSHAQIPPQDWASVQALPHSAEVIVRELGGRSGLVRGKFLLASETEMTVLKGGRPVVIPRIAIARVDQIRRDPVWDGALLLALISLATHAVAVFAGERCEATPEPHCAMRSVAVSAGVGALIDWGIDDDRTIYRAPMAVRSAQGRRTLTLWRLTF